MTDRARSLTYAAIVVAAALAAHVFSVQNGFVDFDDDDYVFLNPHVSEGLSLENVRWAFTTGHAANYHPLTWLSHMADATVWNLNPTGHHLTNVLLHAANSCLLFFVLLRMAGDLRESWCVALLFAVHPLHVESVAWVSERKDLLCALFWLLALLGYARFARTRSLGWYLAVTIAFVCALLSKPMAVTFPFILLLLDFWPLQRMRDSALGDTFPIRLQRLISEKVPWFGLTLAASVATYIVQQRGGAMNPVYRLPLPARIEIVLHAYLSYLWKSIWPFDLSPIYPLSIDRPPMWTAVCAAVVVLAITVIAWRLRTRAPYALVGWLWFAGMLVPVIGIVQIGYTAMADRYMYLPLAGLLIAVVWAGADLLRPHQSERARSTVFALGFVLVAGLAAIAQKQTAVWSNSETLFKHAIAVTNNNAEAYAHLGIAYLRQNRPADAILPLEKAVAIRPKLKEAHTSLGVAFRMTGQPERAILAHGAALHIDSNQATAYSNLGIAYADLHNYAEAERNLREALRIDPDLGAARKALDQVLIAQGKPTESSEDHGVR